MAASHISCSPMSSDKPDIVLPCPMAPTPHCTQQQPRRRPRPLLGSKSNSLTDIELHSPAAIIGWPCRYLLRAMWFDMIVRVGQRVGGGIS